MTEVKDKTPEKWNVVRSRYIPAVYPFMIYFSWPASDVIKGTFFNELHVWDKGHVQAIWNIDCLSGLREGTFKILIKNKSNLDKFRKKGRPAGEKVIRLCQNFAKNLDKKQLKDYLEFLREFAREYHDVMRTNMIFWVFGNVPLEKKINERLAKYNEEQKRKIFSTMSAVREESYSKTEEKEFEKVLELARKYGLEDKKAKIAIKNFSEKYYWFPYEYVGPEIWDEPTVLKKVGESLKAKSEKKEEIDVKKRQEDCIKEFDLDKELVDLFRISQTLTLMQDDRKMQNSHICYYVNGIIMSGLAKIIGIKLELSRYIDDDLLEEYIKRNDLDWLVNRLSARKEFFVQRSLENGKNLFYEGKEGRKLLENEGINLNVDEKVSEIKGITANPGKLRGKVRVLRTSSNVKDFKEGDIIVTGMTTPDFAPLIKKCGAIITDEGGITCHAAIVSRELNKPCIIGTKNATKILRDGDLVEVDANSGIIKILERAK